MRAVVIGAVESTAILADALLQAEGWSVPLIVTLPEELQARHSDFVDMRPYAHKLGAKVHPAGNSNDAETCAAIEQADPDYIFVVGWSQICGPDILGIKPGKVVGYHPAPLPRLRGRAAIPWTILLDERITAGSLFWIDEGTDSGDLLAQHYFHLAGDEIVAEVYDRHMAALAQMLAEILPMLGRGEERRIAQDARYATWAARRTQADGLIGWHEGVEDIHRLVRAVGRPYPGAFTFAGERKLVIWQSAVESGPDRFHARPGQIVLNDDGELLVKTGQGVLRLIEWGIEGDKKLPMHTILGGRK